MTTRPLIGLTGRRKVGSTIIGMPEVLGDLQYEMYYSDYARGVLAAGGLPVNLPMDIDPADIIDRLDGILLSGGADIGPDRYGAEPETDQFPPEPERDEFELALYKSATARGLATLGICRGHQMINVGGGGTLHQDVPPHAGFDQPVTTELHTIEIEPDSILRNLYGPSSRVNSLHHQTIDTVADDLRVTARADDGVIEGLEHRTLPVVSVQWHPEMMATRDTDPIFRWLVEAASATA